MYGAAPPPPPAPPGGSLWYGFHPAPPPCVVAVGCARFHGFPVLRPALSSEANDSDEHAGDDDDEDGGHDPHPHSPPVPCSRVPNENRSNTCSSLHLTNPPETWLGMSDNGRYSFRKNITSQNRFSTK